MENQKKDLDLKLDQFAPFVLHIHQNLAVIYKLSDLQAKTGRGRDTCNTA